MGLRWVCGGYVVLFSCVCLLLLVSVCLLCIRVVVMLFVCWCVNVVFVFYVITRADWGLLCMLFDCCLWFVCFVLNVGLWLLFRFVVLGGGWLVFRLCGVICFVWVGFLGWVVGGFMLCCFVWFFGLC